MAQISRFQMWARAPAPRFSRPFHHVMRFLIAIFVLLLLSTLANPTVKQ